MILLIFVVCTCVLVLAFVLGDLYDRDHFGDRDDWPHR